MNLLGVSINLGHSSIGTKASLRLVQSLGHSNPDAASAAIRRETEGGIWTPVSGHLVEDNISGKLLDIGSRNSLSDPGGVHLESRLNP